MIYCENVVNIALLILKLSFKKEEVNIGRSKIRRCSFPLNSV